MQSYTVEVTWRVPEYTHLTVQADSPNKRSHLRWKRSRIIPTLMSARSTTTVAAPTSSPGSGKATKLIPNLPAARCPCRQPPNAISRPPSKRPSLTSAKDAPRRSSCTTSWPLSTPGAARADATLRRFAPIRNHQRRGLDESTMPRRQSGEDQSKKNEQLPQQRGNEELPAAIAGGQGSSPALTRPCPPTPSAGRDIGIFGRVRRQKRKQPDEV